MYCPVQFYTFFLSLSSPDEAHLEGRHDLRIVQIIHEGLSNPAEAFMTLQTRKLAGHHHCQHFKNVVTTSENLSNFYNGLYSV